METSVENGFGERRKDTFRMTDGQKGKCNEMKIKENLLDN